MMRADAAQGRRVRQKAAHRKTFLAALGMTVVFLCAPAASQEKVYLAPEESAARAKALIQRAITAMGGDAYLKARDMYCEGRFAQFGSTGQLSGYERVYDYVMFPDKDPKNS